MIEAVVDSVGNRAVVKQRGEHILDGFQHGIDAADVQEGFLLAGKGGIRQVFGGGGGADCHRDVVAGGQRLECIADVGFQLGGEGRLAHPFANLFAGGGQGLDILDVQRIQRRIDAIVQPFVLEKLAVGVSRGRKPVGHADAGTGEVGNHFAERCVLAADPLDITHAEIFEPDDGRVFHVRASLVVECQGRRGGARRRVGYSSLLGLPLRRVADFLNR